MISYSRVRHESYTLLDLSYKDNFFSLLLAGGPRIDSRQGQEIFPFYTASIPALGPTQPPIQWGLNPRLRVDMYNYVSLFVTVKGQHIVMPY
jgi:hypothetical protein